MLDKDIIFFVYVQALRVSGQKELAKNVLNNYTDKYSDYTEFWIEKIFIFEDEVIVSELENRWLANQLKTFSPFADDIVAEIMFKYKKINSCLDVINASETRGMITIISQKLKAACLMETERKIDAYNILKQLLPDNPSDYFIVINFLNLTLELKRPVENMAIDAAIRIKSSYALLIVAKLYERDNKKSEAKKYIKQSLILNQGENDIIYGNFWFDTISEKTSNFKLSGVDKDTAVYLRNTKINKTIIYCVCDEEILPKDPYLWNGTIHISVETAIKMSILRRRTGEIIQIDLEEYEIINVIPLENFYTSLCGSKMIELGHAKPFQVPISNDREQNLKAFKELLKENLKETKKDVEIFESYKNFSEIPLNLYCMKQFSKLIYEQFVYSIICDQNTIIRENLLYDRDMLDESFLPAGYVLSYSALVFLFNLGISTETLVQNNVFIPKSMVIDLQEEKELVLEEYNRDTVASIGFIEEKLFLNETSESEKSKWMTLAVELYEYAKRILQIENNCNISIELISDSDVINLCGIVDFDAIALCKQENYAFVNFEIISEGIAALPDINVKNCCILAFIQAIEQSDEKLLAYLIKMVQFKYLNIIDVNLLERFMNSKEMKEDSWKRFLDEVDKTRGTYRDIIQNEFNLVGKKVIEKNINISNNIMRLFIDLVMKLNSIKFAFGINSDGELEMGAYVEPYEDVCE